MIYVLMHVYFKIYIIYIFTYICTYYIYIYIHVGIHGCFIKCAYIYIYACIHANVLPRALLLFVGYAGRLQGLSRYCCRPDGRRWCVFPFHAESAICLAVCFACSTGYHECICRYIWVVVKQRRYANRSGMKKGIRCLRLKYILLSLGISDIWRKVYAQLKKGKFNVSMLRFFGPNSESKTSDIHPHKRASLCRAALPVIYIYIYYLLVKGGI